MRGALTRPIQRTFSFDGKRLFEIATDEKRFTRFEMKLPPQKSLLFLTQTFSPFAPEGYRAPLLLSEGVTVTSTTHPKATQAIEVKVATTDDTGTPLEGVYVLRWPSLDFLAKRTAFGGHASEIRVDAEHCDELLKLCFPKQLSQWEGKELIAVTVLSTLSLNPALPAEWFTLAPPPGFEVKTQELVESGN